MNFLVMDVESSETGEVAPGLTDAFTRVFLAEDWVLSFLLLLELYCLDN